MTTPKKRDHDSPPVVTPAIAPGRYKLRDAFKVSTPDRRLSEGLRSTVGWRKGTMIWARIEEDLDRPPTIRLVAPWRNGHSTFADGYLENGVMRWHPTGMTTDDWTRFVSLLEPDAGNEAWLDEVCEAGKYSTSYAAAALLELLDSGAVTRAQVSTAVEVVKARLDEEQGS